MSGATFNADFRLNFIAKGDEKYLATLRKSEAAEQKLVATSAKVASSTKLTTTAKVKATTAESALERAKRQSADASERLQRELLQEAAAAAKLANSTDQSTRAGKAQAREASKLARELTSTANASKKATASNHALDNANEQVARSTRAVGREAATAEGRLERMGRRGRQALTYIGAGGLLYGITRGIRAAGNETVQFDKNMRNVNSIAQMSEKQLDRTGDRVLSMAGKVAQAPRTLSAGLYDLVSSGFKGAGALNVLKSSAKAATAGLTTTEVATKTVAGVLNAYRMPASKAREVSDILFRTVDRGVISFEELSTTIGDVLPFASSLGVNLTEVGASVATMTKAGIKAPETMTRIKNVMVTLLKPGTDLKNTMGELGYESGEAMIKALGFQGTLDALIGATDGTKASVAALFPNIRSLGGTLALTGKNSRGAAKDLAGMRAAGGATNKALSQQSQSLALKWQKLSAQASTLAINFGKKLIPAASEVLNILSDDRLSGDQKVKKLSDLIERYTKIIADKIPEVVEAVAPTVGEAGGRLGVAMMKGLVGGFTEMDTLGQLFTVAAIMRLVGGPGALLAGGKAVGSMFGTGVNQGAATTVAGGARGRGGWRGKLGGFAGGAATTAGIGVTAMMAADLPTYLQLGGKADDPMERLKQMEARAESLQAKVAGVFDGVPRQIPFVGDLARVSDIFGGTHEDAANDAKRLQEIFEEINDVGIQRAAQLRTEGDELIRNLDATEKQRDAYRDMLSAPKKATTRTKANEGIDELNSGVIIRTQDIARVTQNTQQKINAGWAHGSDQWRKKTAQNMAAQVRAIRQGMANSVISAKNGRDQISKILRDKKLTTGADPMGIAAGYAKSWKRTHEITPKQIARYRKELDAMPKIAQDKAIDAMNSMARGLNKQGDLPKREVAKLRSALRASFGATGKETLRAFETGARKASNGIPAIFKLIGRAAEDGMGGATKAADEGKKKAGGKLKGFADEADRHSRRIKRAFTGIPGPVATALGYIATDVNTAAAAMGSDQKVNLNLQRRRGGGLIQRFQSGGLMPAALSPGELLRMPDGSWGVVPGQRVAADNVLMGLPPNTEVYTDHGQQLLAAGYSRDQALDDQLPHFAGGGKVSRPVLTGGNPVARSGAQKGVDHVRDAAVKLLKKLQPKNLQGLKENWDPSDPVGMVVKVGKVLQKLGYAVGENPAFGSVGGHAEGSYHYSGRAIDVNADSMPGGEMKNLDKLFAQLKKIPFSELLWRVADHFDHLHYAYRKGGRLPGYRKGGMTVKGKVSYFNGPASTTASGTPVSRPGLALNLKPGTDASGWDNDTTRGWMAAAERGKPVFGNTTIAGKSAKLPIIDLGPHESTGRAIDVTEAGVRKLGLDPGSFPTDSAGRVVIGNGGDTGTSESKSIVKVTDDLKRLNRRAARMAMPSLLRGHNRDAFSASFDRSNLTRGVRRAAVNSARVAIERSRETISAGKLRAAKGKMETVRKMQRFGDRVAAKKMPYQYGGGHSKLGRGDPSYDCSGYTSGILGAGGFIDAPMTVARGTGLYTLGKAGKGKYVTWGVRGSSGAAAHTMIRVGDKFYESGSGHGPKRVSGWSGSFAKRTFKGWRKGGKLPGNVGGDLSLVSGGRRFTNSPYGTGGDAADKIFGIGSGTRRQIDQLFTAGNRDNKQVQIALEKLGNSLRRVGKFSVDQLVRMQNQVERVIKRTIDPNGPGGRAITKAEAAMIRRARSILDLVQGALGAKAGRRFERAENFGATAEKIRFDRDQYLRRKGIDSSSVEGIEYEQETRRGEERMLRNRRRALRKALRIAKRAGNDTKVGELSEQLGELDNQITDSVTSRIENARELIKAKITRSLSASGFAVTNKSLDLQALQARQALFGVDQTPGALLEQARVMRGGVGTSLADAAAQKKAAIQYAMLGDLESAQSALVAAREAEIAAMQATADAAKLVKDAWLQAAQELVDPSTFNAQMQNVLYERFQLDQQIAGTFETGGYARRDFILANIVPTLTTELEKMKTQLQIIAAVGTDEQRRQQELAIAQKQNEIAQAQLEAQNAIKENTDPKNIGGTLGFQYGGETLTDQLLLNGNGA